MLFDTYLKDTFKGVVDLVEGYTIIYIQERSNVVVKNIVRDGLKDVCGHGVKGVNQSFSLFTSIFKRRL